MFHFIAFLAIPALAATTPQYDPFPFSCGFDIQKVASLAESLSSHSWEYGTAAEALLELYNPSLSVYGSKPFPVPTTDPSKVKSLSYVSKKVVFGTGYSALDRGNGAVGDPASLGVSAVLVGKTNATFAKAAEETKVGLLKDAPRYKNGAISHRTEAAELWADFIYMAPPFLAYYAADKKDQDTLRKSVEQCRLYYDVLGSSDNKGAWSHIVGPNSPDPEIWSTGNAWAAAGMTRVLATVMKADIAKSQPWREGAIGNLTLLIRGIVDAAMRNTSKSSTGLLRNYWDDNNEHKHGFGEISGSSLLASVVYRMAVLQSPSFGEKYIAWADDIRKTLAEEDAKGQKKHVMDSGVVTPSVNPLGWQDTNPYTSGSPEGQSFVVLMYAAWRDCVLAGICSRSDEGASDPGHLSRRMRHVGRFSGSV